MPAIDYYRSSATRLFGGPTAGEPDGIPILDPSVPACRDVLFPKGVGFGHDPGQYVPDLMAAPSGMKTIDRSEWDARYDEAERTQSSLEHVYLRDWQGENLDQDGQGYCWCYSTHQASMLRGLAMNRPFARLNPHAVASKIKNGKDEGGWCGLSLQFVRENGSAVEGTGPTEWPLHGYGPQLNQKWNDPAFKAAAARFKITDDWYDLGKPVYGQELKLAQHSTLLFQNVPCPSDFNWWSHSVCGVRYVRISANEWGLLILNSWKGWGRRGLAVLRGTQSVPDGAVGVVETLAA